MDDVLDVLDAEGPATTETVDVPLPAAEPSTPEWCTDAALAVMEWLDDHDDLTLTAAELAEALGMDEVVAADAAHTLACRGYVHRLVAGSYQSTTALLAPREVREPVVVAEEEDPDDEDPDDEDGASEETEDGEEEGATPTPGLTEVGESLQAASEAIAVGDPEGATSALQTAAMAVAAQVQSAAASVGAQTDTAKRLGALVLDRVGVIRA